MDRYSNLYGTVGNGGIYSPMGSSPNLPVFLNKIGAVNPSTTVEAVRNTLAGFPKMDASAAGFRENYYSQPKNDMPVAVRYAPMHLYKKPGMPKSMQAFCALSINGNENKQEGNDKRVTVYSHTFYIAREHMHEAVNVKEGGFEKKITYLDQIFGTKILDHVQVGDFRSGKATVNFDAVPEKVVPEMQPRDQAVVFNTISAVFEGKSIVIRLEKDCGFNSRAWELLIPVYSLMPPRLATEIGFATYQEPNAIRDMVADTSIRIFVLPAECELKAVENTEMLVMDLNAPDTIPAVPKDDLGKMLNRWTKLSWELRQEAMEKLFFDTEATFQDKMLFIQRSRDFFSDGFFAWEKSDEDKGTIATLEGLKEKFDSFPLCARIPWVKERFIKKIPMLLKKGTTLQRLTADALAAALYNKNEEEKKQAQQLYRFGTDLLDADAILCAKATGKLVKTQTQEEEEKKQRQIEAAAKASIAEEQKKTAEAVAAGAAALAQSKAEAAAALASEQRKTAEAIASGEAALAQAQAETRTAILAERQKTEQVRQTSEEMIRAEKDAHLATQRKLNAEEQAHQKTWQKLNAEMQNHETTRQQLAYSVQEQENLNQYLENMKEEYGKLMQAKAVSDSKVAAAEAAKAEADQIIAMNEQLCVDLETRKEQYEEMIRKSNQRMIIFAAAGFLAAALIFGIILLIVGLAGGGKPEPVTEPTTIAEMTEAPTEPTEAATEPTEAPTEPTEVTTEPTEASTDLTEDPAEDSTEATA